MKFRFADNKLIKLYETATGNYSQNVINAFFKKVKQIKTAKDENDLRKLRGNNFEKLKGFENRYSIRLNKQYRLEFSLEKENQIKILLIREISKHYT